MNGRILTRQEMILLHLLDYIGTPVSELTMPFAVTQEGIGAAAGMSRSHVSNVVGELEEKGMVACVGTHVKGSRNRRKCYYLLPSGMERARVVEDFLKSESIDIDSVIHRPGTRGNCSPNVVKAGMELDSAKNAVNKLMEEGDQRKARIAMEHAIAAISCLIKEME